MVPDPARTLARVLAGRREARSSRIVVVTTGHFRRVTPDEPAHTALLDAAEGLISAAQRGSAAP